MIFENVICSNLRNSGLSVLIFVRIMQVTFTGMLIFACKNVLVTVIEKTFTETCKPESVVAWLLV